MLNYIWAGLIILSLVFALVRDGRDLRNDTYRNGQALPLMIELEPGAKADAPSSRVKVTINAETYQRFYDVAGAPADAYAATMLTSDKGRELKFAAGTAFPAPLATVVETTGGDDKVLSGRLSDFSLREDTNLAAARITFPRVYLVTMKRLNAAAIDSAKAAITLALSLIGVLALWLGLMRIAEAAGLINLVVIVVQPVLRFLFPEIPKGHPAMGMVALNLTANVLGLGNAATPFGIKAMEELQKLNRTTDTATNPMVMLLAMNTAGVQIVPPAFLFAVMGMRATELLVPVWIATGLSLVVAIVAAKLLGRLPGYRRSDPDLLPAGAATVEIDHSPSSAR